MRDRDAARLEHLLNSIPPHELVTLVGRRRFQALHNLVTRNRSEDFPEALVGQYAVALDGTHLLDEPAVLSALLARLDAQKLQTLAKRYLDKPFTQIADNALFLASKPLRIGSSLSRDILSALGLSDSLIEEVDRKPAVETIEPYEPLPPLLDYQAEVKDRCAKVVAEGTTELLIQMPTGAGKTRTAMELIVDLVEQRSIFTRGLSVIWLAHTEELCEQAIDSFSSVWSTRGTAPVHIVRLWGTYSPPPTHFAGAFIVAGTARLHALKKTDPKTYGELCTKSAIVVLDEAHRALAPTVLGQLKSLRNKAEAVLIGLSATPARSADTDQENAELAALFGYHLITPALGDDPIEELRRRGILSELERIELRYSTTDNGESDLDTPSAEYEADVPEAFLAGLATNLERNLAIIDALEERMSGKQPALVFCCTVEHASLLAAAMRLRGIRTAAIDCRMRRSLRRLVIQEFSKGELDVLLNFGVLSTGFDAPKVRTVVIARPTRSMILYSQMLGRGLRGPKMGGTGTCTLIDVRDHLGRFGDLNTLYLRFKPYWTKSRA